MQAQVPTLLKISVKVQNSFIKNLSLWMVAYNCICHILSKFIYLDLKNKLMLVHLHYNNNDNNAKKYIIMTAQTDACNDKVLYCYKLMIHSVWSSCLLQQKWKLVMLAPTTLNKYSFKDFNFFFFGVFVFATKSTV